MERRHGVSQHIGFSPVVQGHELHLPVFSLHAFCPGPLRHQPGGFRRHLIDPVPALRWKAGEGARLLSGDIPVLRLVLRAVVEHVVGEWVPRPDAGREAELIERDLPAGNPLPHGTVHADLHAGDELDRHDKMVGRRGLEDGVIPARQRVRRQQAVHQGHPQRVRRQPAADCLRGRDRLALVDHRQVVGLEPGLSQPLKVEGGHQGDGAIVQGHRRLQRPVVEDAEDGVEPEIRNPRLPVRRPLDDKDRLHAGRMMDLIDVPGHVATLP